MCLNRGHTKTPPISSQTLPLLSWLRPSSSHFVALPGGVVLSRSPLTCVRASPLFPGNTFKPTFPRALGSRQTSAKTRWNSRCDRHLEVSSIHLCGVSKRAELEASGYLDLSELARVVLHGAHDLVTQFLLIVIPQQIFALKKHKTEKTQCHQTTGTFDIAETAHCSHEQMTPTLQWVQKNNVICLLICRLSSLRNQTAASCRAICSVLQLRTSSQQQEPRRPGEGSRTSD